MTYLQNLFELTAISSYLYYKISIANNLFLRLINHPEVMLNISTLRFNFKTSGDWSLVESQNI